MREAIDRGRPLVLLLSQGQMSGHKRAGLLIDVLPLARALIADRGYDRCAEPLMAAIVVAATMIFRLRL